MKNIAIIGSTGSIGAKALKVIEANPDSYRVVGLAAGTNIDVLLQQIEQFRPLAAAIMDGALAEDLRRRSKNHLGTKIFVGTEGVVHVATMGEVDTVISAISGAAGLGPTYAAIEAGKNIALANKETMVMAGSLIMRNAKRQGVSIVPIDSEHSAILQSLQGHHREDLRRIILTASGGPFLDWSFEAMKGVTPKQALKHPNWRMGKKITIDSATLMNKGLEAIEAKWLFDLAIDQISILVHPQSVIHSMVEYKDGSIIAQMGVPDMVTPISYALSYPRHFETPIPPLNFEEIGTLSFTKPDTTRFPCLDLALRAAQIGGSMPAVLNGANEVAVDFFLRGEIGFLDIPEVIEKTMEAHEPFEIQSIKAVMEADAWSREAGRRLAAS
jgi:1-deoxy-D-xylulose-5-phosphate reductoisomerase